MGVGSGEDPQIAQIVCAGTIEADGTVLKQRGCVVVRTGVGTYTITIDPVVTPVDGAGNPGNLSGGIPAAELVSELQTTGGAAEFTGVITNTSDTIKTVHIEDDASAPADNDFEFVLKRSMFASSNP